MQKRISAESDPDYYVILRNAIVWTFLPDIAFTVAHAFFSEGFALFYSYFIIDIIRYIKDPDAPMNQGVTLIVIFISIQSLA